MPKTREKTAFIPRQLIPYEILNYLFEIYWCLKSGCMFVSQLDNDTTPAKVTKERRGGGVVDVMDFVSFRLPLLRCTYSVDPKVSGPQNRFIASVAIWA